MNYAHFAEYVRGVEDDLVQKFGVSREGAKRIVTRLEIDAINDYTGTKDRNQLIIEYRELGPAVLAERMGVCRETVRRKYEDAVNKKAQRAIAA